MKRWPLSRRLSAVFAVLLLACCGASVWLQMHAEHRKKQEVAQRLSIGLAAHMASHSELMAPGGPDPRAVEALFHQLMAVNPSVEVYLLGLDGRILAQAAPPGHLKRDRVDLGPVQRLLAGGVLPILGEDPRSDDAQKVFDATPLRVDGRPAGYLYVVLLGENHDALTAQAAEENALRATLWTMALVAAMGVAAGLAAFSWITRPLRQLTSEVNDFDPDDAPTHAVRWAEPAGATGATGATGGNEIAQLRQAFARMTARIAEQMRELSAQDQQRRELVANISHDLRTPLTSLHGYLETLRLKSSALSEEERLRYLDVALGQSRKVGRLAQELFELARLEYGVVKLEPERFSLPELVQDVFQKFELAAEARRQRLVADIAPMLPVVSADLGMIERVLTNLLDNAIRHTPEGGLIELRLRRAPEGVEVQVSDTGPGIPPELQKGLFTRPSFQSSERGGPGGLGLVIVRRILQLHGSEIRLLPQTDRGTVFRFCLGAPAGIGHDSLNSA
ncbi:MAG: HAMP domain-containing histidine kinase [Vitreoscilla sp.]|nr:HAMP domain-containing histidine kinase [Vitreoscilla sp.]